MFELNHSISQWKNSLKNNSTFTYDDIEELESHLLDKIDDLLSSGVTSENAFNQAIDSIGNSEELSAEYQKVTQRLSVSQKLIMGILGFILIESLFNIIKLTTIFAIAPFSEKILELDLIHIPVLTDLYIMLYGSENYSNLTLLSMGLTTILTFTFFYFALSNKRYSLLGYFKRLDYFKDKKLKSFLWYVFIPTSLFYLTLLINARLVSFVDMSLIPQLIPPIFLILAVSKIILLTILILKKYNINNYIKSTLSGYFLINILLTLVPNILALSLTYLGIREGLFSLIISISISLVLSFFIVTNKKARKLFTYLNKNKLLLSTTTLFSFCLYLGSITFLRYNLSANTYGIINTYVQYMYFYFTLFSPLICYLFLSYFKPKVKNIISK